MSVLDSTLSLATSPSPRGFAFVLFQDPLEPLDWGVKDIRGDRKNARSIGEIKKLLRRYQPNVVVLEGSVGKDVRRGPRIRALLKLVARAAEREGALVRRYSRTEIRKTFEAQGARVRPDIARVIAEMIPAFAPKLPPPRKIWMSEDPRQSLFDAAAIAITYRRDAIRPEKPSLSTGPESPAPSHTYSYIYPKPTT